MNCASIPNTADFLRTLIKTRYRFKTPFTFYYRFASYTG